MLSSVASTAQVLRVHHYLGPTKAAGFAWHDQHGVAVFANPRGRHVSPFWLELVRWCLTGGENAGSQQWAAIAKYFREHRSDITTIVSYSDPSQGHTGALYRACNWLWAPTWHRLRPPPTGNGSWSQDGKQQGVKDRWIYPLRPDLSREHFLRVTDGSLMKRMPWAQYREPKWRGDRFDPATGGGDYKRWMAR